MRQFLASLAAIALALSPLPALAYDTQVQAGFYNDFSCASAPGTNTCNGITRPANATPYTNGQLVCGAICAPIPIMAARASQNSPGSGQLRGVTLLKSTATVASITFTVFFYAASPNFPSLSDQSGYTGPYKVDITSGIYIGSAACSNGTPTTDTGAYFYCPMNYVGVPYKTTGKLIYAVIEATSAYTPGNGEQFWVLPAYQQD